MGVFHVYDIGHIAPNRAKRLIQSSMMNPLNFYEQVIKFPSPFLDNDLVYRFLALNNRSKS